MLKKLEVLKKELEELIATNVDYNDVLKKSEELDYYITKEMIRINKKELSV